MSIRFRICNFIMKDYLRNYLAIDRMVINNIIQQVKADNNHIENWQLNKLQHICDDIEYLFHM